MTAESRSPLARLSPKAMAVYLSLALIAIHLILLLGGLVRQNAANRIAAQLEALQTNVQQLNASEQAELETLQESQARWQERVDELEAQLPDPSQPFPVYAQAQSLAKRDEADVLVVERTNSSSLETVAGPIQTESHNITLDANLPDCLAFMTRLEQAGGPGLSLEVISIIPELPSCAMTVATVARTTGP